MNTAQKTRAGEHLSMIMKEFYLGQLRDAAAGKFCAWIAIIVPVELLRGFDMIVAIPENYSAMTAAKGAGPGRCDRAHELGFSRDLCSYARIDFGNNLYPLPGAPFAPLPRPDLLISDTNNCSLLVKWFDVYHREYRAPHFILDVPFCYEDQKEPDLNYIVDQYHDLIKTIETMTGQTCDYEKVRRAVQNTAIALKEWKRFARAALSVPSGITAFDTFVHMASYITLRGTEELVEQYRLLADDTEELVARGAFPVKEERYRLLWDNIAPWHQLRKMSARLAGLKANIVAATYTSCMGTLEGGVDLYEYDGGDPLRYLARIQNSSVCPYGLNLRYRVMEELIRRYSIDGVVFASNRSCKVYSVMQLDLSRMVRERLGVPVVMVDVDHADVTRYSEEAVFSRIEALLEQIDVKKNSL